MLFLVRDCVGSRCSGAYYGGVPHSGPSNDAYPNSRWSMDAWGGAEGGGARTERRGSACHRPSRRFDRMQDEPSSGLDSETADEVMSVVKRLAVEDHVTVRHSKSPCRSWTGDAAVGRRATVVVGWFKALGCLRVWVNGCWVIKCPW